MRLRIAVSLGLVALLSGFISSSPPSIANASENQVGLGYLQALPVLPEPPLPSLLGEATVGKTLTVDTAGWDSSITKTYAWWCGGQGQNWTQATFVIPGQCAGTTVRVVVFGAKTGFAQLAPITLESSLVALGTLASVPSVKVIWNMLNSSVSLEFTSGLQDFGLPIVQWFRDNSMIKGANDQSYNWTALDSGRFIYAQYTFSKPGYYSVTKNTPKGQLPGTKVLIVGEPGVIGNNQVGETLSFRAINEIEAGAALAFQWLRNGQPISGQNSDSYLLRPVDAGQIVSLSITVSKDGFSPVTKNSAGLVVKNLNSSPLPSPGVAQGASLGVEIYGSSQVGTLLVAKTSQTGAIKSIRYFWHRDGIEIDGAASSSYLLTNLDAGKSISVKVIATDDSGKILTSVSKVLKIDAILGLHFSPAKPVISGKPKVGQLLTHEMPSWGVGVSYRFQWQKNGKSIPGATNRQYRVQAKDRASKISLKVFGSTSSGFSSVTISNSVAIQ